MSGRLTRAVVHALDHLAPKSKQPQHLVTGLLGEEDAYFYLRRLGYVMVARNWRSPRCKGELDLVEWKDETVCFIEVKTRTNVDLMPPEAAVDGDKRTHLGAVAREYLRRLPNLPQHRFDVLSIPYLEGSGKLPQFTLFKNSFPMD
jgi:putative endonuclease